MDIATVSATPESSPEVATVSAERSAASLPPAEASSKGTSTNTLTEHALVLITSA
jgi:hypothetical protein